MILSVSPKVDISPELTALIAEASAAAAVRRVERIQSLWSGYGELFRAHLEGARDPSVIVKWVKPPEAPRGGEISDARKRRSYEVETSFYRDYGALTSDACRVPAFVASRVSGGERILILEDLDAAGFRARRQVATPSEMDACLAWLASFHATFLGTEPEGLWEVGTYWHLATRPDELAAMDDDELRQAAPLLDRELAACTYKTLVHGDAKLANFCFSPSTPAVAAVDFQYTGAGCGMRDVAYLLGRNFESDAAEQRHLDHYFRLLRAELTKRGARVDLEALEAEWRPLYPIALADYYRFLAGWAKPRWEGDARGQRLVREVLRGL